MTTILKLGAEVRIEPRRAMSEELVYRAHKRLLETIKQVLPRSNPSSEAVSAFLAQLQTQEPRASAFAASFLAEPFGFDDQRRVEEVTFASLCLDAFSHAVDDATDVAGPNAAELYHVGGLLLAKAAQVYGGLVAQGDAFWKYWERCFRDASDAERFLWKHRGAVIAFDPLDFIMLGQKSALINISAAFYASATGRWELLETIESGLNAVATGVQLVDDLLDWEEDDKAGNYTFPLVLANARRSAGESLGQTLNSGTVVGEVLGRAESYLKQGRESLQDCGAISLTSLIDSLLINIGECATGLHESNHTKRWNPAEFTTRRLKRMISPKLGH